MRQDQAPRTFVHSSERGRLHIPLSGGTPACGKEAKQWSTVQLLPWELKGRACSTCFWSDLEYFSTHHVREEVWSFDF